MKTIIHLPLLFVVLLMSSCLNIIETPLPPAPAELIVNCLFSPDSTWKVNVSANSTFQYSFFLPPYISTARVSLNDGTQEITGFAYTGNGNYRLDTRPVPGKRYRIKVEAEGYPTVEGESYVPANPPDVREIEWGRQERVPLADNQGGVYFSNPISFNLIQENSDPCYYLFNTVMLDSCNCLDHPITPIFSTMRDLVQSLGFDNRDPLNERIAQRKGNLMLSNLSFLNQNRRIEGYVRYDSLFFHYAHTFVPNDSIRYENRGFPTDPAFVPRKDLIQIYLDTFCMSEEMYLYMITYLTQGFNTSDPFAVHINASSNMSNNRGIFAGFQRKWYLFHQAE